MSIYKIKKHIAELNEVSPIFNEIEYTAVLLGDSPDIKIYTKDNRCIGVETTKCVSDTSADNCQNAIAINTNVKLAMEEYKKITESKQDYVILYIFLKGGIVEEGEHYKQKAFIDKFIAEIDAYRQGDTNYTYKFIERVESEKCLLGKSVMIDSTIQFCGRLAQKDVETAIKKKNKKLEEYEKIESNGEIDEYWLVINTPYDENKDIKTYYHNGDIVSNYDRIYLTKWDEYKRIK